MVTAVQQGIAGFRHLAHQAHRVLAHRLDGQRLRLQLAPCRTRTAAALAFDLAVFVVLAVLGWALLMPWDEPLREGGSLMLLALMAFALFWLSITEPDFWRFARLRRRWLAAQGLTNVESAARRLAPSTAFADSQTPLRVRSAYRPTPPARPASRWAWRAGARS